MINSGYTPAVYAGNGTATVFPAGFKIVDEAHVKCTEIDDATGGETALALDTDFTVSGVGAETGAAITYPVTGDPMASGKTLVIELDVSVLQEVDFENQGGFFPQTHETAFDKVTQILQIHKEQIARAVKTDVVSDETADELKAALVGSAASAASSASAASGYKTAAEDAATRAEAAAGSMTLASQAEAEAGVENTKFMSPLRTKQAIDANAVLTAALTLAAGAVATNAALVASGGVLTVTVNDNFTLSNPTNPVDGKKLIWRIKQDATGSRVMTLGNKFKVSAELGSVVLSTTAGHVDMFGAIYNLADDLWSIVAFQSNITAVA